MNAASSPQAERSARPVAGSRENRVVLLRECRKHRDDVPGQTSAAPAQSPQFTRIVLSLTHWYVHRDWKSVLLDDDGLRLDAWLESGAAQVVKRRSHRIVYRVALPQGSFYVKQLRSRGVRDFLRDLLRGNRAWREWRRICEVGESGIAVVTPLAVGLPGRPRLSADAYLVTAAAEGTEPLDRFLAHRLCAMAGAAKVTARHQLAREMARFVARMHQAGIEHRDFHPGNVLISTGRSDRRNGAEGPSPHCRGGLVLVDMQAVSKQSTPLRWEKTLRNLVTLNLYFSQHASRSDRLRFWRCYLKERSGLVRNGRDAARRLEQRTAAAAAELWRRRDRRCVRQGRYFYRKRYRGAAAHAVRELPEALLEHLLRAPDGPLAAAGTQILKRSSGSQVASIELRLTGARRYAVYKRWKPRNWRERVLSWLRPSKAMHAWRMGHALVQRGISTPRPLAMIQKPTLASGVCSYLLWEEIAGARHLHEAVNAMVSRGRSRASRDWLRTTSRRLALLLRRMHDLGFDHRDLKAANILVTMPNADLQGPSNQVTGLLHVLDLDAVGRRRSVSLGHRLRNLSRLLVSFYACDGLTRSDKLRFLDDYLPGGLAAHGDWKRLCRRLDHLARRKIRRNERRGRVLA